MTEAEWLACEEPMPVLKFLRGKATERKLRLFCVACCRRHGHIHSDERSRTAVGVGELLADGLTTEPERAAAEYNARQATHTAVLARQSDHTIREHFIIAARLAAYAVTPGGRFDFEAASATVAACRLMVMH